MKTQITEKELAEAIGAHRLWLANKGGEKLDLSGADLRGADLRSANLEGADLRGADISNTFLDESESIRKGMILKHAMLGYKKCDGHIVTLEIPRGAIVFSINRQKCRTNIAKVVTIDGTPTSVKSNYDENFTYAVGETKKIDGFSLAYNKECASGIHFFMRKQEAEEYQC